MAELKRRVGLLDGDIVLAVLEEEVELDVFEGGPIDEAADVVLQLIYIFPLVLVPHLPQLLLLRLSILTLKLHLSLVQLTVQLLQHQDQPPRDVLQLAFALTRAHHQLHTSE